ncbi:hypothetical protein [Legionella quinlivanii]|nr:hypothetical protein [Legionella quinlivanii]
MSDENKIIVPFMSLLSGEDFKILKLSAKPNIKRKTMTPKKK